jgi:hypothetical protein
MFGSRHILHKSKLFNVIKPGRLGKVAVFNLLENRDVPETFRDGKVKL